MRGVLLVGFTTTCVVSVAWAQVPPPRRLSGRTQHTSEDSCSQSWAIGSDEASLQAELRQGSATITIDRRVRSTMGSQPEIGEGASWSPPSVMQVHTEATLRGTFVEQADRLEFDMTEITLATARWQGEGTLPLGAPTTRAVALHIHCDASLVQVHSAETHTPTAEAPAEEMRLYLCRFTDRPEAGWDALLPSDHTFPLAQAAIFRVTSQGGFAQDAPFFRR